MQFPRAVRFIAVGGVNTAFSYVVYALGIAAGLRFELANLLACVAGIIVGFRAHGRFVFSDAQRPRLWRYFAVWIAMYGLNVALIATFLRLGLNAYVAGALATPVVVVVSYLVNRQFVFRAAPSPDLTASTEPR